MNVSWWDRCAVIEWRSGTVKKLYCTVHSAVKRYSTEIDANTLHLYHTIRVKDKERNTQLRELQDTMVTTKLLLSFYAIFLVLLFLWNCISIPWMIMNDSSKIDKIWMLQKMNVKIHTKESFWERLRCWRHQRVSLTNAQEHSKNVLRVS